MKELYKVPLLTLLVGLLVLVRHYEQEIFYDPFMAFFEGRDADVYLTKWYLNMALRFFSNMLISLLVLFVVFQNREVVKFAFFLFILLFIILFPVFVFLMREVDHENYLSVFYIRRFLVHPLMLLILLPAFYYQYLMEGEEGKF